MHAADAIGWDLLLQRISHEISTECSRQVITTRRDRSQVQSAAGIKRLNPSGRTELCA